MTPEQKIKLLLEGKTPKEIEQAAAPVGVENPAVVPQIDPQTGEVANPDIAAGVSPEEEEPAVSLTNPLSVDPVDPTSIETKSVQQESNGAYPHDFHNFQADASAKGLYVVKAPNDETGNATNNFHVKNSAGEIVGHWDSSIGGGIIKASKLEYDKLPSFSSHIRSEYQKEVNSFVRNIDDELDRVNNTIGPKTIQQEKVEEACNKKEMEELTEAIITDGHWKMINGDRNDHTSASMFRARGKTWPTFGHNPETGRLFARDDNGRNPSQSVSTSDVSVSGLRTLLNNHISKPHPSDDTLQKFIDHVTGKNILKEQIDEGMRIVSKHGEGQHTAKVYKDSDWDEYRVKYFKDGKHAGEDADYHTDDLDDAKSTAEAELSYMNKHVAESVTESYIVRHGKVSAEAVRRYAKELFPKEKTLTPEHLQQAKEQILSNVSKHKRMRTQAANEPVQEIVEQHSHSNARGILRRAGVGISGPSERQSGGAVEKSWTTDPIPDDVAELLRTAGHRVTPYEGAHVVATYYGKSGEALRHRRDLGYDDMMESYDESAPELLAADANLTEEYKVRAKQLFEAAVETRALELAKTIQEEAEKKIISLAEELQKEKEEFISTMSEKIDVYLDDMSEKWMVENRQAIEEQAKVEIMKSFMAGVKALYEQHNMTVPEGSSNIVEEMQSKLDALQSRIEEQQSQITLAESTISDLKEKQIITEASEGLTKIDKMRFEKLIEEVEFTNESDYRSRIEVIKDQFFQKRDVVSQNLTEDKLSMSSSPLLESEDKNKTLSPRMQMYLKALQGSR